MTFNLLNKKARWRGKETQQVNDRRTGGAQNMEKQVATVPLKMAEDVSDQVRLVLGMSCAEPLNVIKYS